jgi:hypothetical protein
MIPEFDESWIQHFLVHRERYVEPLHVLNGTHLIPPIQTPLENLFLTTTAQIYPALTNAESIFGYARVTANKIWVTTTDRTELDQKLPG